MKPKLSFLLCSYNQESFIREALLSALAQDYDRLEVIVQDDGSTDRTIEIVNEVAASYRGPHSLQVHQNERNLGIGASFSRGVALCQGELLVIGAGDDISLPERASVLAQAWEASRRRALGLFSSYVFISEDGAENGIGGTRSPEKEPSPADRPDVGLFRFLSTRTPMVNGCSEAWSRELFDYFGPVQSDLEDVVLSFRTLALGELRYVDRPLVKWRRHGGNVSFLEGEALASFDEREKRLRWVDNATIMAFEDILKDIDRLRIRGRLSGDESRRLVREARRVQGFFRLERAMMEGPSVRSLLTWCRALGKGDIRSSLGVAPRLLPRRLYRRLYTAKERRDLAGRRKPCPKGRGAGPEDS
jgi:glycosyltransferase involved in cell wall biosynthesis